MWLLGNCLRYRGEVEKRHVHDRSDDAVSQSDHQLLRLSSQDHRDLRLSGKDLGQDRDHGSDQAGW